MAVAEPRRVGEVLAVFTFALRNAGLKNPALHLHLTAEASSAATESNSEAKAGGMKSAATQATALPVRCSYVRFAQASR